MPRGQKSKLRAREKRRKARDETQDLGGAQATAAEKEESASSPSPALGNTPPSSHAAGASCTRSKKCGKSKRQERKIASQAAAAAERAQRDPIIRKAGMLVQFMLYKYKMQEPITKVEMLRVVQKRYREHFPEILKRAAERVELVFGLDLKEVNPRGQSYTLVSKLDINDDGSLSSLWGFPKNGLLMPLLGVIFLNGNSASEEEIWEFLNILGVYDGKKHFIFGEPRQLITEELVQEEYLVYQQVPNSDPPRFEFLWGPRAHAETSKMKVLEFLAKINDTVPSAFPSHYEEALKEEEEQEQDEGKVAARPGTSSKARGRSRPTPRSSSHP
ncbi:melanoma-associated antigen B4-like [Nycticebus coucang]|uniref:melanoma-associated antigen B4-like n=1 Tax=Nycticebus coucang TaxID=9470 RepID=UPI00234C4A4F|nr:melanoma-associated antigen B4-like [Nycticebus coucang]